MKNQQITSLSGDELIKRIEALANPHRLRIIALLSDRRIHVSQLAREMMISRPLLYLHLKRLENAGLVTGEMELAKDGKAMHYYAITPFAFTLSPETIKEAVKTLSVQKSGTNIASPTNEKEDK